MFKTATYFFQWYYLVQIKPLTVHKPHLILHLQTKRVTTATILPVKPSSAIGLCCQGVPHLFPFHYGLDLQTRWFPCLSGSQDLSQKHSQSTEKNSSKKRRFITLMLTPLYSKVSWLHLEQASARCKFLFLLRGFEMTSLFLYLPGEYPNHQEIVQEIVGLTISSSKSVPF